MQIINSERDIITDITLYLRLFNCFLCSNRVWHEKLSYTLLGFVCVIYDVLQH